ncbi:MAG: polyphosphate polymerase domain-containing protein [bacterium]
MKHLKFSRFEYKYLLPSHVAFELMSYFSKFCVLDAPNVGSKPYTVRSLYFDSPTLTFYHEKVAGTADRQKVRLRTYGDEPGKDVYMELKLKPFDKIYKEREILPTAMISNVINHFSNPSPSTFTDKFFRKLWFMFRWYRLTPQTVVRYSRISLLDKFIKFKVSFDSNIRASADHDLYTKGLLVRPVGDQVIMEIKCEHLLPVYFLDAIRTYNLERRALSKYTLAMSKLIFNSQK